MKSVRRRSASRGLTRFEILVWVAALGLVSIGVAFGVSQLGDRGKQKAAVSDAAQIRDAAQSWRSEHDAAGCPTLSRLIRDRSLASSQRTDDPWGERYRIECKTDDVSVISSGADRRPGTDDDILVPGDSAS